MARSTFFVDRCIIVRQRVTTNSLGAIVKEGDYERNDWIPCRISRPSGGEQIEDARRQVRPGYSLQVAPKDEGGNPVRLKSSDQLRLYRRLNNKWIESPEPYKIVGPIVPNRHRTRLISYTIDIEGPELEY